MVGWGDWLPVCFADRLVYAFKSHTGETFSLKLKLMMRSVLFVVVWVILTILTMTSVANTFLGDSCWDWGRIWFLIWVGTTFSRKDINSWFWQIKNVTELEKKCFCLGSVCFLFINGLVSVELSYEY